MNVHQFPKRNRPPEWEELFKKFQDLVGSKKKRANGSGSGGGSGGSEHIILIVVLILLGAWAALTSFYVVDVSERGVVTRFGKYLSTSDSGPHLKLPFGIDHVYIVPKDTLQEEFGFRTAGVTRGRTNYRTDNLGKESLMLTGDLNVANVEWAVQYRIADPWKFLFNARDVKRNIRDISMSIMRRVVGDRLASDVLTTGRVAIAGEAKDLMQRVIDEYEMGILIEQVILQDVNPPDPVKPAFNEVNAAKQEQEQAINNAERQYNKIIPEARGKAEKLIADAEAYSIDIVNRAKGDASLFRQILIEYKKAPKITRERLYIETMEKILRQVTTLKVVDKDIKGLMPVYGRLDMPSQATTQKP